MALQVFDREAVIAALTPDALLRALAQGRSDGVEVPPRHAHAVEAGRNTDHTQLLMPAWQRARGHGGVKISNLVPGNTAAGLPTTHSSYLLYDNVTGAHVALLDAAELTARRTAAVSALAARSLAPSAARTMLLIGAGTIAGHVPAFYRSAIGTLRITVCNRDVDRAKALVQRLEDDGFEAAVTTDLPAALTRADIVVSAVPSESPGIRGDWLHPGQHLDLIGSYKPHMREVDDAAVARSTVWVDTRHALAESGDLIGPIESGVLRADAIAGTLFDLEENSRRAADEITMFKNAGSGWADLIAAMLVLARGDGDAAASASSSARYT